MKPGLTTFTALVKKHHDRLHAIASGGADEKAALAASVILLLHEGWEPHNVAAESGMSKTRVLAVRRRFLLLGLAGLRDPEPSDPRAIARRMAEGGEVSIRVVGMKTGHPGWKSPHFVRKTSVNLREQPLEPVIAGEAENLLRFHLAPEHRRRMQAMLDATNPKLPLAEVARRAGVAPSTVSRWWAVARREGIQRLLLSGPSQARELPMSHPQLSATQPFSTMNTREPPADLERIDMLPSSFRNLLEASGIRTASDLADNVPVKLHRWLEEVNSEQRILRSMPPVETVAGWVRCARSLGA